jgi:hypothetical protein
LSVPTIGSSRFSKGPKLRTGFSAWRKSEANGPAGHQPEALHLPGEVYHQSHVAAVVQSAGANAPRIEVSADHHVLVGLRATAYLGNDIMTFVRLPGFDIDLHSESKVPARPEEAQRALGRASFHDQHRVLVALAGRDVLAVEDIPRARSHVDDSGDSGGKGPLLDRRRLEILAEEPGNVPELVGLDEQEGVRGALSEAFEVFDRSPSAVQQRCRQATRGRSDRVGHRRDPSREDDLPFDSCAGRSLQPEHRHIERLLACFHSGFSEARERPVHRTSICLRAGRATADLVGEHLEVFDERRGAKTECSCAWEKGLSFSSEARAYEIVGRRGSRRASPDGAAPKRGARG